MLDSYDDGGTRYRSSLLGAREKSQMGSGFIFCANAVLYGIGIFLPEDHDE